MWSFEAEVHGVDHHPDVGEFLPLVLPGDLDELMAASWKGCLYFRRSPSVRGSLERLPFSTRRSRI
jgi:hypothetical protein